jgi:O-antigen/teichoic acid export membrane protein
VASTAEQPPPAASDNLRTRVSQGLAWKMATQVVGQGSRTIVAIVLARLLTPKEFGLAGMALVFTGIVGIFTDLALGIALIQRKTITEADRSTVFWTTMAAGLLCTAGGIAAAPLVGDFFSNDEVIPLFAVTSLGFVFSAFSVTQVALLTREMDFRSLELREMIATVASAVIALVLAVMGFGAWAIVIQSVAAIAIGSTLVWVLSSWRPTRAYSGESLRTLGSFGSKTLVARILGYLNLNVDNLLIGRYIGSRALGVYTIAYNVMFLPLSRITAPIQQVLFAAFVRLQDEPRRLGDAWLRGNRLVSAIAVPAFAGIAVVAPDFVPVVLGPQWHEVIPVLQLLSLAGIAQSYQTLNWAVLQARGKVGLVLWFMWFSCAVTVGGFVIGLQWGVVGVAASYAVARTIVLVGNTWLSCRETQITVLRFAKEHIDLAAITIGMAAVVYVARLALVEEVPQGVRLVVLVALGGATYCALVACFARDVVAEIRDVWARRGGSPKPAA